MLYPALMEVIGKKSLPNPHDNLVETFLFAFNVACNFGSSIKQFLTFFLSWLLPQGLRAMFVSSAAPSPALHLSLNLFPLLPIPPCVSKSLLGHFYTCCLNAVQGSSGIFNSTALLTFLSVLRPLSWFWDGCLQLRYTSCGTSGVAEHSYSKVK